MRFIHYLTVCAVCLTIASPLLLPAHAAVTPARGIAVLASSIGSDFTPEDLARSVRQGNFSLVVVDWAWITYHWERTDFRAVNRFLELMSADNVSIAAMYRPRFLSNPTVATQTDKDGKLKTDHEEICYSDQAACQWGISWGEKILAKCPNIKEIIIYNPMNECHCPKCTAASTKGAHTAVMGFLSNAKSAWRAKRPDVKLGVVYMPYIDFWKAGLDIIDVAHPFLCIREEIDPAKEVTNIQAVRSIVKDKMGPCLGKITWEEGAKVSINKLKTFDEAAIKGGISYFFWTYETLFHSSLYDPAAVAQSLASTKIAQNTNPTGSTDKPDETQLKAAETLLDQVIHAEHGAPQFAAINEAVRKIKEMDVESRSAILSLARARMNDKSFDVGLRWPFCYVISRSGDEEGVSDLIQLLLQDESQVMRSVAAEALGGLRNNPAAREAMLQSAGKETNPQVREVLNRYLGQAMPSPGASSKPAIAVGVEELAPSGPPEPPAGPARPVAKPLSWPFPGDSKAQNIFNNYQTATDEYIHCGLDFLHPAGTPVTAVSPGYVSVIWSREPHTGDFFIVTPKKGGDRGWCYTHLDPKTFTFKEGDFIQQGQLLGKLVLFSPNEKQSMDHLHLHYVSFTKEVSGQVSLNSLIDPLYFFDWKDTKPPSFRPLWFVAEGTTKQFQADSSGIVAVNGKVDILAAITDTAYDGQQSFLGVPVVMFSISDGRHTMQKLVIDHRGNVGDSKQTKLLYLSREEARALANPASFFPYYQVLRVTKTDGDGKITPQDAGECWDTTALDSTGKPLWPDGKYSVNVYAWDISGNRGVAGAIVQVKNGPGTD
ncbi:MAG: peptidoglycan DD-metalloendopeptidase family protein [Armatimonadota bacterium]